MTNAQIELETISTSLTVSDMDRALRFYCEGLGYKKGAEQKHEFDPNSEAAKALDITSAITRVCFVSRPHSRLEIISYERPKTALKLVQKPPAQPGLNALHYRTPNVKALAARLVELGGTIVQSFGDERCIVADPDGMRIQFAAVPAEAIQAVFAG